MILAEKIMKLRKQNGWSQEELAAKLNVTRQSVSKWESRASIPDLDKILKLSELFGVSTDYLLKDEMDMENELPVGVNEGTNWDQETLRQVSVEEADQYLNLVEKVSKKIALGVSACVLSPVLLILLSGLSEFCILGINENMAAGIGVAILLFIIAGAVTTFILYGMKLDKYNYLEREGLSLQYGVAGIVESKKDEFEPFYKKCLAAGVALCILSAVPLMIAMAFNAPEITYIYCVDILLILVAFAVFLFVWSGMILGSYKRLLEEGEYTRERKLENKKNDNLSKVYWCTVTAIYLAVSFLTGRWEISWVIWPCAGVFFAAVCGMAAMLRKR
ncbi:MAG: helix-turn-helix transcriptional regulator [Anaerobutyricum sp.]|nr:helix-turn-helix domain-containing protein [Eubacterium sp.]MDY6047773.1 helix-turn-helix transcriptional regulator [Anaerobutyricum sp.]